ncbi:D-tagatose-bisphosphate aldolase, class II, non-catalytic subunit [Niveispirillum irakense]|uniref:D-tagatose-bisphosphate aldolase, class II, non-catalytic subunit n=1 Tax=Niveispirillum irakense TaxID=34011 RepID=UPI0003F9075A|nr:D-tagatose-bisphosphate aldolase, class II, non-catalytic subunit [Niveispirillum irakense]
MKAVIDLIARHKAGSPVGIYSVCSAHPLVIEATFIQALRAGDAFALIEATSNQVNQDGGYTGMRPADFRDFVYAIADKVGFDRTRILLGGDHLGPNVWQNLPPDVAMEKADLLIAQYVAAGFRKIHLDCSMSCAGDPVPLSDATIATRAARLALVAEKAYQDVGGEAPVYVIGTEVPVPGGAAEDLGELAVTTPEAARATIETHRAIFQEHGLVTAWERVVAAVVQPGVEFDHHQVVDYVPAKAQALSHAIDAYGHMVYEAHSTDYQTPEALAALVRDHFAILKVGPGVTFALREALWALDAIEREWVPEDRSGFRDAAMATMRENPKHWAKYYHAEGRGLDYDLQYSLSDRIRYYWPEGAVRDAQEKLFANLIASPPPLSLVSQYMPAAYAAIRAGQCDLDPAHLVIEQIIAVLASYSAACRPVKEVHHA